MQNVRDNFVKIKVSVYSIKLTDKYLRYTRLRFPE